MISTMIIILALISNSALGCIDPLTCAPKATSSVAPATPAPFPTRAPVCKLANNSALPIKALACGSISFEQFNMMFNESASTVAINLNFIAMRTACELAHITQLDFNQAAFWLGSIASNTDNLQMPFATKQEMKARADNGTIDPFWPKGVLRMQGEANYTAFTNYTMNLGLNINSTSNTQFVANNHIMSYLSGLFLISAANTKGDTCLSLTSAGKVGECIAMLDQSECQNDARLMHHLFNIKVASGILGCEYKDSEIVSFECPKKDCVAPATPAPTPRTTECTDNNGTSVAPVTPSPTKCPDNNGTSIAPATTAPVIVSPAKNQTCNDTSVAPMTPEPTVKICHKCEIEQIISPASTNSMLTTLPLFAIAIASLF